MKLNRTNLIISITSIALFIVLLIQIKWIYETARIKEELFNEKANIVLARTTDAITKDTATCRKLEMGIGNNEIQKIDSLIKYYLKFYNFHLNYTFEVIKPTASSINKVIDFNQNTHPDQPACYQVGLENIAQSNGWELKMYFPEKKQYILAEMGIQFITSVVLIILVFILSLKTIFSLMREKQLSEHSTDFLNNMTHEFKTPLTNISLAGKMLAKESASGNADKIKHYSEIIIEENEKLKLQVEHVLSMTALERGEIRLRKTIIDFHELIHDALKMISIQIENKEGIAVTTLNADKAIVSGDKTHLTNVMYNLIENAIKYSEGKPELLIHTFNTEGYLNISVTDKGVGIEREYQKNIFDKYFRVPTGDVHDVKGFGLGLAYTKKIIDLHQGTVTVQSEKNKGSTFTIALKYV